MFRLQERRLLDTVRYHAGNCRTAEEYERRNPRSSLTRHGEAAFTGVRHAPAVLASPGTYGQRSWTRSPGRRSPTCSDWTRCPRLVRR